MKLYFLKVDTFFNLISFLLREAKFLIENINTKFLRRIVIILIIMLYNTSIIHAQTATLNVYIDLDGYEDETTWTLTGPNGFNKSGGPYTIPDDIISLNFIATTSGTYTFTILDSYGDGLSDSNSDDENGISSYKISKDGIPVYISANQPNFGYDEVHVFIVNLIDPCDPIASGNADADGDGISDICDLDDDNDGILDSEEICTSTPEYANWTWNSSTSSGAGSFSCSAGPDFTYSISNYDVVTLENTAVFSNTQQTFETIYGQADSKENLNIRTKQHSSTSNVAIPLVNYATLTINFTNPTSIDTWAFSILDIDADQIKISAKDANNNAVSNSEINNWFQELFDADPSSNGVNLPYWDATNAALVGASDVDGIYNTITQTSVSDIEAPGGWFQPTISLTQLTLTFSSIGASNYPSYHIYIASSCCAISNDIDNDGMPNNIDLDSDNDECPDALEGGNQLEILDIDANYRIKGTVDQHGVPTTVEGGQTSGSSTNPAIISQECINNELPVELYSQNIKKTDNIGVVSWITSSERNNHKFIIEKSIDNQLFSEIGTVLGVGNSNVLNEYSFIDYELIGEILYYRIRQIDFDGKSEVFPVMTLYNIEENNFKVYPNPTSDILFIETQENNILELYNINNQLINKIEITPGLTSINMEGYKKGVYYLKITLLKSVVFQKILLK